jgi:hypothetical protein
MVLLPMSHAGWLNFFRRYGHSPAAGSFYIPGLCDAYNMATPARSLREMGMISSENQGTVRITFPTAILSSI